MRKRLAPLALLSIAFALGAAAQPPGTDEQLPGSAAEVSTDDLRTFVAIFVDLRENAAGFPGMTPPPPDERRESIDIIEEHGWTLWRYNRMANLINSTPELFRQFSQILDEGS